jgi:hypothetical protein
MAETLASAVVDPPLSPIHVTLKLYVRVDLVIGSAYSGPVETPPGGL